MQDKLCTDASSTNILYDQALVKLVSLCLVFFILYQDITIHILGFSVYLD